MWNVQCSFKKDSMNLIYINIKKKFQPYIAGETVSAITDHTILTWSQTFNHILFRWSWYTYSIRHGGWRMSAGHGDGAVLHNKTVVFYPPDQPFHRQESRKHRAIHYDSIIQPVCNWVQVYALSIFFPPFLSFTHHNASDRNSIQFYWSCF